MPSPFARPSAIRTQKLAVLLAMAALALAACGTSASPTQPLAQASPSGAASSASSSPSSSPAASSAVVSPSATPNVHAAPELEARLPDSIGGVAMSKFSMGGVDFMAGGSASGQSQLKDLLQQLGKTDADLLIADTYDPTGASPDQAAIFEVKGADAAKLLDLWVTAQTAITNNKTRVSNVTVDGKRLTRLEDFTSEPSRVTYAWSSGDSIVIVAASTDAVLQELVSKMAA